MPGSHFQIFLFLCLSVPSSVSCDLFNKLTIPEKEQIAKKCGWNREANEITRGLNISQSEEERNVGDRIIGGRIAQRGQFPFIVAVQHEYGYVFCSGMLISPRHILSARHCFLKERTITVKLLVGGVCPHEKDICNMIDMEEKTFGGFAVYDTAFEGQDNYAKDIALFELEKSIDIDTSLDFICLTNRLPNNLRNMETMGWGLTSQESYNEPGPLQYLGDMHFLSKDETLNRETEAGARNAIENDFLLAMVNQEDPRHSPYSHDSGGLVVYKNG
ncbi:trypsin domain-containing protein [Ditylenchus destructor]|uniref:Trypsin domain-containing protein n=1 Tax=Ditylenchus destructor TaxID=166010 RepID=A0AAD4MKV9_9BILA|nr:trypsin domain-containing protein [Ditylenchus destructor]